MDITIICTYNPQIDGVTHKQKTASEILSESVQLSNSLRTCGIKIGDTVGICSESCFEFAYVSLAAIYLGVTLTAFSSTYTESKK